jgi:hypothetical protein
MVIGLAGTGKTQLIRSLLGGPLAGAARAPRGLCGSVWLFCKWGNGGGSVLPPNWDFGGCPVEFLKKPPTHCINRKALNPCTPIPTHRNPLPNPCPPLAGGKRTQHPAPRAPRRPQTSPPPTGPSPRWTPLRARPTACRCAAFECSPGFARALQLPAFEHGLWFGLGFCRCAALLFCLRFLVAWCLVRSPFF